MAETSVPLQLPVVDAQERPARWRFAWTRTPDWTVVWYGPGICLLLALILWLNPVAAYWMTFFEPLGIYRFWPLIFAVPAVIFPLAGYLRHASAGHPLRYPWSAWFSLLFFVSFVLTLLVEWAADWTQVWTLSALWILLVASVPILIGYASFGELWRRKCNQPVIETVRRALEEEQFRRYRPRWGSRHCLAIVDGHFRCKLLEFLHARANQKTMEACLAAGEQLLDYLAVRWNSKHFEEKERRSRTAEVSIDLCTAYLWGTLGAGGWGNVDAARIDNWLSGYQNCLSAEEGPFLDYLRLIFALGNQSAASAAEQQRILLRNMELFTLVPRNGQAQTCAQLWIAIAPSCLPDQLCLDVWLAMRESLGEPPILLTPKGGPPNIVRIWAQNQLAALYQRWVTRTPEMWTAGLTEKAGQARALAAARITDTCEAVWKAVSTQTETMSSWPYRYVWKTARVRGLLMRRAAVMLLAFSVTACAINPATSERFWGWNTIDRVTDRRALHDYTTQETRAMVASPHWLALATNEDFLLLNKASRVPRRGWTDGSAESVTRGPRDDDFFVLGSNLAIKQVDPASWLRAATWLPGTSSGNWAGAGQADMKVVANTMSEAGWTVFVSGRGVARYAFGTLADGRRFRRIKWETGNLSSVPLKDAVVTDRGAWVSLLGGGLKFADLNSLNEVSQRSLTSPEIERIGADPEGRWAGAVDIDHSLWLYPPSGRGWIGPYFGQGPPKQSQLRSAADVIAARMYGAWGLFGTSYGLYSYDTVRRRISQLATTPTHTIEADAAGVWAAGSEGLQVVGTVVENGQQRLQLVSADSGQIEGFSLSPDGSLGVYRRKPKDGAFELRVTRRTQGKLLSETVAVAPGWKKLTGTPEIREIRSLEPGRSQKTLVITSAGCLVYDPADRSYHDCSTSFHTTTVNGKTKKIDEPLSHFEVLDTGDSGAVTISERKPHVYDAESGKWRNLDPDAKTHPVGLTFNHAGIFGLEGNGEIHRYTPQAGDFLTGVSAALQRRPSNTVRGDAIQTGPGQARLVMIHEGSVIHYDSDGNLKEAPSRFSDAAQIRLYGDRDLYLLRNGRIVGGNGEAFFGAGGLPFSPSEATALAPGVGGTVLLGGPSGAAYEYKWQTGSFAPINPKPSPALQVSDLVTRIQENKAGIFVETSGHGTLFSNRGSSVQLPDCRHWATLSSENLAWLVMPAEIQRVTPQADRPFSAWDVTRFSTGVGMRDFVAASRFAWRKDKTTIAFFTASSRVGLYSEASDSWQEAKVEGLQNPSTFQAGPNALALIDGSRVIRVTPDLKAGVLTVLPDGATRPSLRWDGDTLRLVFVKDHGVVLQIWYPNSTAASQFARGGGVINGLDLTSVVRAEVAGSLVHLIDINGNCGSYDPIRGYWSSCPAVDPRTLPRPADGTIIRTSYFRVVRKSGDLRYEVPASRSWWSWGWWNWQRLHNVPGGFAEDSFLDAAMSPNGKLWGLRDGTAVSLDPVEIASVAGLVPDEGTRQVARGIQFVPELVAAFGLAEHLPDETVAISDFAGSKLEWTLRTNGTINASWQGRPGVSSALPVWASDGRLSTQSVDDLALSASGELLLSSQAGLLVRDAKTYVLRGIYPEARGAQFLPATSIHPLMIQVSSQFFEWNGKAIVPSTKNVSAISEQVASGPWRWEQMAGRAGLSIIHEKDDSRRRSWSKGGDSLWRFDDDLVQWVYRASDGNGLTLTTKDGAWRVQGSERVSDSPAPAEDRFQLAGPAMSVDYATGNLTFHPLDNANAPAFERGRFFVDNGTEIASSGDSLYVMIPDRVLIQRNAQRPGEITAAWKLPAAGRFLLDVSHDVIRLRRDRSSSEAGVAFTLDPKGRQQWIRKDISGEPMEIQVGSVVFRASNVNARPEPFVTVGEKRKIEAWWSGDRFSWDQIASAAALDGDLLVLSTDAGIFAQRGSGAATKTIAYWRLERGLICQTAREGARRIGVYLTSTAAGPRYLITESSKGGLALAPVTNGSAGITRAVLKMDFKEEARIGRHIALIESWEPGSSTPALKSPNSTFAISTLIFEGQFAFDRAIAAAPVDERRWMVASGCLRYGDPSCVISLYDILLNSGNDSTLVLRGTWPAPCPIERLGHSADGAILALCHERSVWEAYRVDLRVGAPSWTRVNRDSVRAAFRVGQKIELDVQQLAWKPQDHKYEWDESSLTITPPNYPLFAPSKDGVALAFDAMTGIDFDPSTQLIHLGTLGGIFRWSYQDGGGEKLLAFGQTSGVFQMQTAKESGNTWLVVDRFRRCAAGQLWARLVADGRAAKLRADGEWEAQAENGWPRDCFAAQAYKVNLGGTGFEVGGAKFTESNDALGIGQRPLENIEDFELDPDAGVLWLATRKQGVFKISLPAR